MDALRLVIGNKNYSSWSLRPWLALRQAGIAFEEHRIALDTREWRREIVRHSPSGLVPVLHHGDRVVWDSLAICEYVAEQWPRAGLWPRDGSARAMARSASAEMHSGFRAMREHLPMNCRRRVAGHRIPDEARRDVARVCEIWRECRARHGADGPYLFGAFTIADAIYAPVASRFATYGVPLGEPESRYVDTLLALPAMRDWMAAAAREPEVIQSAEVPG